MTPEQRRDMRLKRLHEKGMGVAQKLSDLLAGKDIRLGDIGLQGIDMVDDKEQRLRQFLQLINDSRRIILASEYPSKVAAEETRRQLFLDDNPWLEAAKADVAGGDNGDA